MTINTPEELLNRVAECMNSKDLDAFVSLYEPEGSFIDETGANFNGPERIREKIRAYMDMNGKLENNVRRIIPAGNVVLAYSDWTFKAPGPDGSPINLGGTAIDVLRKQSDNSWLIVIDNPWGIKN